MKPAHAMATGELMEVQKLMGVAAAQGRINLGSRKCTTCGELSPSIICTSIDSCGNIYGGYTMQVESENMIINLQ